MKKIMCVRCGNFRKPNDFEKSSVHKVCILCVVDSSTQVLNCKGLAVVHAHISSKYNTDGLRSPITGRRVGPLTTDDGEPL